MVKGKSKAEKLSELYADATNEEIQEAWGVLKKLYGLLAQRAVTVFRPGQQVEFVARGAIQRGMVTKINQKSVSVKVGITNWKVAPSLLKVV